MVLAVLAGTILYIVVEGWSLSDALYMTVITLTTVGYKEVRELDDTGRLLTMALAGMGVVLLFGGVGIMAEVVLAEIWGGRRERRRMQDRIAGLEGHHIVCGYGRVGSTVAEELRSGGRDVVVVDNQSESLERARLDGHLVVEGDATDEATMAIAGIARAAGLIASVDSDAANVYLTLSARGLNPDIHIVARANAPAAEARLAQAGADRVVSPYTMAGRRIAALATRPALTDFLDTALSASERTFSIEQYRVTADGPLVGASVGELDAEGVLTLAILTTTGEYEAHPPAERELRAGEELIVSGAYDALMRVSGKSERRPA